MLDGLLKGSPTYTPRRALPVTREVQATTVRRVVLRLPFYNLVLTVCSSRQSTHASPLTCLIYLVRGIYAYKAQGMGAISLAAS